MKLTRFLKLRKAVDSLDPLHIRKKLGKLDEALNNQGLLLSPRDTAITQDGIFYIEPQHGIATKVIAYVSDFATELSKSQIGNLSKVGYGDKGSIERFHSYHLTRCNVLRSAEQDGWPDKYRIAKRTDGTFYYKIVSDPKLTGKASVVYQEIERQKLYVCQYCHWKAASILLDNTSSKREDFNVQAFFDVDQMKSWNSFGELSKDYGFTKDMYPEDWKEISRVRMEQTNYTCEYCYRELTDYQLRQFLHVHATDYVEKQEGYFRLECLCISCISDLPQHQHIKKSQELELFRQLISESSSDPGNIASSVSLTGPDVT